MNKQLELFLHQLDFDTVYKGELHYEGKVEDLFEECQNHLIGACDEESEIWLGVVITKTCSIRCFLSVCDTDRDCIGIANTEFSMINATPGAIEDWILSIDFDALAKGEEAEVTA